ncbi:hypothetical protein PPSIR1_38174 [Plesiocystis pacifica SIR-1]|uniref:Uncharacterized protein n=1 Tax=Plesiocystis pacifica SIR-1 TaxID=391625 RepID=A6GBR4_9BACT|nr:RNA polymerase sigma factor [Plesiocystis pacifica]EDM76681.1 hypothetical protein PPSIR1_38174 [Plesiocystis pacifica SIR-1]
MSTASSIRHIGSSSFRGLQDVLARFVARYIRPDDAHDIVQDTWLAAMNYRGESSRKTYLIAIARRKVAEYFRGRYRRRTLVDMDVAELEVMDITMSFTDIVAERRAARELHEAVRELPPEFRVVVELYLEGKGALEISAELGVNYNTVRSRLSRSRGLLRKRLGAGLVERATGGVHEDG